jgi:hypothetical protein
MAIVPSTGISVIVLLLLAAVLAASCTTFALLVRRATSHRQWVTLADWAGEASFRFEQFEPHEMPPPLDLLSAHRPLARICLAGGPTKLVELETHRPTDLPYAAGAPVDSRWHLLVRTLPVSWRPTGLRPAGDQKSILDLFSLTSFPRLAGSERFVVFGTDSADARVLAESMLRSLLPPDVGLLLHGSTMTLDFSARPFDPLEFSRMLALADQLADRLPVAMEPSASRPDF